MSYLNSRSRALFTFGILAAIIFAQPAFSQSVIHVPADQPTIQQALFAAQNGDSILVSPGTYFESINFQGKAVTVASTDGPAVTTISGGGGPVVQFQNSEGNRSVLRGFTITNGFGGGILVNSASPIIEKNIITGNQGCQGVGIMLESSSGIVRQNTILNNTGTPNCGGNGGGGIEVDGVGSPQVLNNTISGNQIGTGSNGGGISVSSFSAPAVISGNVIQNNFSDSSGGGIFTNSSAVIFSDNLITGNSAANGGGINIVSGSSAALVNNTIAANQAAAGSQLYVDGSNGIVQISNNIFYDLTGNGAIFCSFTGGTVFPNWDGNDVVSLQPGAPGTLNPPYTGSCSDITGFNQNIQQDPLFLDAVNGNYHPSTSSPMLDAGDNSAANLPLMDLDGNPRIAAGTPGCRGIVDIGAYEFLFNNVGSAQLQNNNLQFPNVGVGTQGLSESVVVSGSAGCAQITSIATTGDFQQTNNCSALQPGTSCSVQVTFLPKTPGIQEGMLTITIQGSNAPLTATLTGEGQNSGSVSPTNLNFGNQLLQTTSPSQSVEVLSSSQLGAMLVNSIAITGDFTQFNSCTGFGAVNVCFVNVSFDPTAVGPRTGTLTVNTTQGVYTVPLSGNGAAPLPSFAPTSLAFPSQTIGSASTPQNVTFSNAGNADLQIFGFQSDPQFAFSANTCPPVLSGGASCILSVVFTPFSAGPQTGTLTVNTNAGPATLIATGTGTPPIASLTPQNLSFVMPPIGSTSAPQTVTLTNISGTQLQLTSISAPDNFQAVSSCPAVLNPNAGCTIAVTLTPLSASVQGGFLSVATSLGTVTAELSVTNGHRTIHVPADVPSIQQAIISAQDGDTVLVSPGTYFEQINFSGKAITVASVSGPSATILDGQGFLTPVFFFQAEGPNSVLRGFTITHAQNGIAISGSSPTIENNVITGNNGCNGVGIQAVNSSAIIRNNTVANNTDTCGFNDTGAGIMISAGNQFQLLNNTITGNQTQGTGGGLYISGGSGTVSGNKIQNNSAGQNGGGMAILDSSPVITDNLVSGNSTNQSGGGVYASGGSPLFDNDTIAGNFSLAAGNAVFLDSEFNAQFINNIIVDSEGTGALACNFNGGIPQLNFNDVVGVPGAIVQPATAGQPSSAYALACSDMTGLNGNIQQDPQFANAAQGDYHLTAGSPAIDAGIQLVGVLPDQDLDGKPRVGPGNPATCSGIVDMGAYEFQLSSSDTVFPLPSTLDFGIVPVTSTSNGQILTISVQGCVQLASVKTTGDFQQSNSCNGAISGNHSCFIQLSFTPTATGLRTGTLTLDFGVSSPSQTIGLTGQGTFPGVFASPGGLGFAGVVMQTSSTPQGVTIVGNGGNPLLVNGVWISGDFSQTSNCAVPSPAGPVCSINVVFTPTALGRRTGALTVSTNQGIVTLPLSGTGLAPTAATVTPSSLAFGNQLLNTVSASQSVTLTNTGSTVLNISSRSISAGYRIVGSSCPASLNPGQSCVYNLVFAPTALGPDNGVFAVISNAGTLTVSLTGNGVAPIASVSPQSLTFAPQILGATSASQSVTLTNIGNESLTISIISATGDFAQTNACTTTLAAGASCTISVTFAPAATGIRTGTLNISTNGGSSAVALSGTGANPVAGISASSVAFGSELQGVTSTARTLTLTAGVNPLQISGITTSGDFSESNTCGASLAPATSCSIQVAFAPASTSAETGTLTVSSDEGVLSAQLSGSGITRADNTIYVPVDQPTIQAAISAAVNGQTVTVLPGTYFEHIDFGGKAITLNTSDGPGFTTIDGSNSGTVVTFATGEGQASVLSGFTITHGLAAFNGSGILASSASPTIQNNVITANGGCDGMGIALISSTATVQNNTISKNVESGCTSGEGGGGILARGGTPQILNNVITGNTLLNGGFGGGISLNGSSANVVGNTIQHNAVFNEGGGINIFNSGSPNITQNLITDNSANGNGGGIYWSVPSGTTGPIVVNNTIANNTAAAGSAVFSDGFASNVQVSNNILVSQTATASIDCSGAFSLIPPILSNNDAVSVGDAGYAETCAADLGVSGNISADPQFIDPMGGNFHLQPASPAIDAGTNSAPNLLALDLDGNPRIALGNASTCSNTIDLGVYEFQLNSPGLATLSPASFDFGVQSPNTSSGPVAFTVSATRGCVSVKSASATGDFVESNNCSSILPTGGSCTVQVTFTPSAAGARSGVLSVNTDTIVLSSNLTGQGGVATASVSPANLTFGNQLVGTTSAAQTVTLSNSGNLTLSISSITAIGDFAESNACAATLAPGASCTMLVTFTPTARLTRTGTLVIQSNSNSGTVSVSLSGTGIAPIASLTPSLTFAPQVVGTTTAQTATLSNNGDAALDITSIVTSGDFAQTNSCGSTLAPAASCSIQVSFTPAASGTRTGSLTVSDDALSSPQQVTALSGTGLDYAVSASPTSVTVKQGGTANYTVSASQLGGSFPNAVSLSCSGLPVGASCTFSPASVTPGTGSANSALSLVTSNGAHGTKKTPTGTYSITITGTSGTLSHKTTVTLVVN